MEKNVIERISDVLQYYNVTPNELAKKIGISSANAYNYVNGRVKEPPLSFIISFLEVFDEISAEWLLRGNGPMQTTVQKPSTTADYVNQAAINAGIQFAAEDPYVPQTWQQAFDTLQKQLNEIKSKIQ